MARRQRRGATDWGEGINFDGKNSGPVREFFLANAGYWIDEFHLDRLRLDATQDIHDSSDPRILAELVERVKRTAGRGRRTFIVVENEPQNTALLRARERGGYAASAAWNDDSITPRWWR